MGLSPQVSLLSTGKRHHCRWEKDTRRLVDSLFDELIASQDVVARLRSDPTLSDRVRKLALWMAEERKDDPKTWIEESWEVASSPGHAPAAYRKALRQAKATERLAVNKVSKRRCSLARGMAQYRLGAYEEALETLAPIDKRSWRDERSAYSSVRFAFIAMALYQLGRAEEAETALDQAYLSVQDMHALPGVTKQLDAFLREAEELILGVEQGEQRRQLFTEAYRLVRACFAQLPDRDDVLRQIRSDEALGEPLREASLRIARLYQPSPWVLDKASWAVVASDGGDPATYRKALRKAQMASRTVPSNEFFLKTLGAAQYRVGAYEEALTTLTRSDEIGSKSLPEGYPATVALLAMTLHQLGRTHEAQATLERLRVLMQNEKWAANDEAQSFLREAESLICGAPGAQPTTDASTSPDPVGEPSSEGSTSAEDADKPRP